MIVAYCGRVESSGPVEKHQKGSSDIEATAMGVCVARCSWMVARLCCVVARWAGTGTKKNAEKKRRGRERDERKTAANATRTKVNKSQRRPSTKKHVAFAACCSDFACEYLSNPPTLSRACFGAASPGRPSRFVPVCAFSAGAFR